MSGRRIDDHSNWIGGAGKNMVMPQGVHTKSMSSEEGSGSLSHYEDTDETIKSQQAMSIRKAKAHPQKAGYRN